MLGRWLGAPVGAQRLPGGDGEAVSLARARARRGGARGARLAGRVPAAKGGSRAAHRPEPARTLLAEAIWAPSRPRSYSLACVPAEATAGKSWLHRLSPSVFNHAKLSGRWNESPKQGARAPCSVSPECWGGGEINPQSPGSWRAQRRLEVWGGIQPRSLMCLPFGGPRFEVKLLCRFPLVLSLKCFIANSLSGLRQVFWCTPESQCHR